MTERVWVRKYLCKRKENKIKSFNWRKKSLFVHLLHKSLAGVTIRVKEWVREKMRMNEKSGTNILVNCNLLQDQFQSDWHTRISIAGNKFSQRNLVIHVDKYIYCTAVEKEEAAAVQIEMKEKNLSKLTNFLFKKGGRGGVRQRVVDDGEWMNEWIDC